jgi:2,3-dihydroxybenzoate decarboxylase
MKAIKSKIRGGFKMMKVDRRTFFKIAGMSAVAISVSGLSKKSKAAEMPGVKTYKKICVEEHFSSPEHIDLLRAILEKKYPSPEVLQQEKYILGDAPFLGALNAPPMQKMLSRLYDVGKGRVEEMDKYKIDMQVVSLVCPGVQVFEPTAALKLAEKYNNHHSALIKEHPKRFAGLTCLAPQVPEAAADELERGVRDLKFKGGIINSHTKGEYLDNKKYWVIFERAEKLGVPIYLHPRSPSPDMMKPYLGYPMLDSAMWGFGAETGLHAMRLICSGVFDEYPKLKIVLGHMGEMIPGQLSRIDNRWAVLPFAKKIRNLPGQYFRDNFVVNTSGMFSHPVLAMTLSVLGADSIMFAVDYPMEDPEEAISFMNTAPISDEDKEKIYHLNAERVFSL